MSESSGPLVGGQVVTITGKDFTGTTTVKFGAVAATDFALMNDKQIVATVPNASAAGKVLVEVTNGTGANTTGAQYEYKAPKITKLEPAWAKEDDSAFVTITGEGLLGTATTDVTIAGEDVLDVWVISDKQIVVETPIDDSGNSIDITDGETNVVITRNSVATTPDDDSKFLYTDGIPAITGLLDSSDGAVTNTDGVGAGDTLTITGTNLYAITEVKFGTSKVTGTDITLTSATEIDVEVPSKSSGPVDIIVSNAAGDSLTNLKTQFSFLSSKAPSIKSVYPEALDKTASTGGGTVLVTGTDLTGVEAADVTLSCSDATVSSATSISDKSLILVLADNDGNAETCTMTIANPVDGTLTSDAYTIRFI